MVANVLVDSDTILILTAKWGYLYNEGIERAEPWEGMNTLKGDCWWDWEKHGKEKKPFSLIHSELQGGKQHKGNKW